MTTERRATDGLEMTDAQKAFLDQMCGSLQKSVAAAISEHETAGKHLCRDDVEEVVKLTLAAGDFVLPNGQSPGAILEDHNRLFEGQDRIERNQDRLLDVVVGPVMTDWKGDEDPDGLRDESQGLMAQNAVAVRAAEQLEKHMANGGVPVKLPTSIKAAIWGAAGAVVASSVTAAGLIVAAFVS